MLESLRMSESSANSNPQQPTLGELSRQMERIEHKLDQLALSKEHKNEVNEKKEAAEERSSSKMLMSGALGLVGAKLGALAGAKIGAAGSAASFGWMDFSDLPGARAVKKVMLSNKTMQEAGLGSEYIVKMIVNAKVWALAGALLFGIPSAALGYKRGDRLAKATDLLTKPIDSVHRLIQSETDFIKDHPDHPRAKKASGAWQEKVKQENDLEVASSKSR